MYTQEAANVQLIRVMLQSFLFEPHLSLLLAQATDVEQALKEGYLEVLSCGDLFPNLSNFFFANRHDWRRLCVLVRLSLLANGDVRAD